MTSSTGGAKAWDNSTEYNNDFANNYDDLLFVIKNKEINKKRRKLSFSEKLTILKMYFLQSLSYTQISKNTGIIFSSIYRVVNDYKNNNDNASNWFKKKKF